MIIDATDATINPNSKGNIEVISIDALPNVDPIRDPQAQPRVLARQIPPSTARGQMQLGAPNIFTDSANRRITVQDDNQVSTVAIGNIGLDSSGTQLWGMKVAQTGVDVTTATDNQLIFNSNQDVFKIVQTGTITATIANGIDTAQQTVQIKAHNLGYNPGIIAFMSFNNSSGTIFSPMPYLSTGAYVDGGGHSWLQNVVVATCSVDTVNITLIVDAVYALTNSLSPLWTMQYYLLQETAGPLPEHNTGGGSIL